MEKWVYNVSGVYWMDWGKVWGDTLAALPIARELVNRYISQYPTWSFVVEAENYPPTLTLTCILQPTDGRRATHVKTNHIKRLKPKEQIIASQLAADIAERLDFRAKRDYRIRDSMVYLIRPRYTNYQN